MDGVSKANDLGIITSSDFELTGMVAKGLGSGNGIGCPQGWPAVGRNELQNSEPERLLWKGLKRLIKEKASART